MSWLKMEASTPEKSEVLAITAKMGWDDQDLTVGKLFRIWRWFDQQTTDGNAPSVTAALLDRVVGVSGFCHAMQSVGWLVVTETEISLPNFERHNGNTAKNRALTAKRVASCKINAKSNAPIVTDALPREEKRREDIGDKSPLSKHAVLSSCPHIILIDLFSKHLPTLSQPRIETWGGSRANDMKSRWRWLMTTKKRNGERYATNQEEAILWFERFFTYVSESDLLMGKKGDWSTDLGWLMKAGNFAKVIEGKYHE